MKSGAASPIAHTTLAAVPLKAILAHRAAQALIQECEKVKILVLIDTPVPWGLDRLPQRFGP